MASSDDSSPHKMELGEKDAPTIDDIKSSAIIADSKPSDVFANPPRKKKTFRWLVILFWATLFLLVFQVLLGWLARAVTLLADSAHGGADVISYGLNVFVEWLKIKAVRDKTSGAAARAAKVVDTWGSLASLLTLVFATFFAVIEAIDRLNTSSGGDTKKIGSALLVFSIVSTGANTGLLVTYRRWRNDSKSAENESGSNTSSNVVEPEIIPPPPLPPPFVLEPPPVLPVADLGGSPLDLGPPSPIPDIGGSGVSKPGEISAHTDGELHIPRVASKPRRARKKALNLSADFAGVDETDSGSGVGQAPCQKSCCSKETFAVALTDEMARSEECSAVGGGRKNGVLSTLHMAIHPGCTCSDHDEIVVDEGSALTQESTVVAKARNLNLVAALLHLITDVLRGILILIVALLIELGGVQDAERADAVCALIVACLIALGALALFIKVAARLWSFLRHINYALASTEMGEEKVSTLA